MNDEILPLERADADAEDGALDPLTPARLLGGMYTPPVVLGNGSTGATSLTFTVK